MFHFNWLYSSQLFLELGTVTRPSCMSILTQVFFVCLLFLIAHALRTRVALIISFIYKLVVFLTSTNNTFANILSQLFPSLFCIYHKIFRKWGGYVDSWGIYFHLRNLPPCGLGVCRHNLHISYVLSYPSCGGLFFWHLKHLNDVKLYYSVLSRQYLIFTSLGILGWLKLKMYVFVWFFYSVSIDDYSFVFCDPLLSHDCWYYSDVAKDTSHLLIIRFEVINIMQIRLAFCRMKYFKDIFGIPPIVQLHN